MKNLFTLILCLAAYSIASAHTTTSLDSAASVYSVLDEEQPRFGRRFQNYWFLNVGVGGQIYYGDHNKQMDFAHRLTPVFDIRVGNWFNPKVGARVGINGFKVNGLTQIGNAESPGGAHLSSDEWYDQGQFLKRQEISFIHIGGDAMFRALTMIEENRKNTQYELMPYIGLGLAIATSEPKARNMSLNIGLANVYAFDKNWEVALDVRAAVIGDGFDGERGGRNREGQLAATIGVFYNFR